jgi:predicted TIM-barrel fold metal-dependent hydrolase
MASVLNRFPDRFLFGTDTVAPADPKAYYGIYELYAPLWRLLTPEARRKILKSNYERLFDEGRRRVREWERANVK